PVATAWPAARRRTRPACRPRRPPGDRARAAAAGCGGRPYPRHAPHRGRPRPWPPARTSPSARTGRGRAPPTRPARTRCPAGPPPAGRTTCGCRRSRTAAARAPRPARGRRDGAWAGPHRSRPCTRAPARRRPTPRRSASRAHPTPPVRFCPRGRTPPGARHRVDRMADMRYRRLGDSGLRVSVVGLGCNNFGRRIDADASREVVAVARDLGVILLDTAETYGAGLAEEYLGAALKGRRDDVVIATKYGHAMGGANGADWGARGARRYIVRAVEA